MTFKQLFYKYGVAAIFSCVRKLHDDIEDKNRRIEELELMVAQSHNEHTSDLKELLTNNETPPVTQVPDDWGIDIDLDPVPDGKIETQYTGKQVDFHPTAKSLVADARRRYDAEYATHLSKQEALAQVEQYEDDVEPEVRLSEAKKQYYLERGKAIVAGE